MNDVGSASSPRAWDFYSSSSDHYPIPAWTETYKPEAPWKNFGPTSINAISFGFVATAILISLFLLMAIFEHLFRPTLSSSVSPSTIDDDVDSNLELELGSPSKSRNQDMVMRQYLSGLTVLMPGQKIPTCIAQPAPLFPFPREGICWPHHEHKLIHS